jgi:predicted dehydrogenase
MEAAMLRAAIVGCGNIADAHAANLRRIKGVEIAGACDREELMARQLCDRFAIPHCSTDVEELIEMAKPDVVHITTSPQSHYELGSRCLNAGCHVYMEKPFTLNAVEAEELVGLAERKGLKLTAGHDAQFSHSAMRMRELIRSGFLGGAPVHMESTWCYALSDPVYARAFLGNKEHWVRQLPGGLLQNIISHGIARIAELWACDDPRVIAHGFVSPFLRSLGEEEIVDELRVIMSNEAGMTAYFTFSSQMKPVLQEFKVYGPKNGLLLDEGQQILRRLRGQKFKSYADRFLPQVILAGQGISNAARNARLFLKGDFHMDSGKKYLIEAFYRSIAGGGPLPISYREILLTARVMDSIFSQLNSRAGQDRGVVESSVATVCGQAG